MGIDKLKKATRGGRTEPTSKNPYLLMLVKLYRFLARRTGKKFNKIILQRLYHSRTTRFPVAVSKVSKYLKKVNSSKSIAVVVGPVCDDARLLDLPKMKICALKFTEAARSRIVKAGGECLTFDQLALRRPNGKHTILLRGAKTQRTAYKYFGAPGVPGSKARNKVSDKKKERARGKRSSRGYKA
eukprot:TRINITY_DN506_c0_g1_i1.p1 TRINITY_DN506_c0_g1~~TRINITY_DN506_c0_g1_i1.p1  ORF type:complete len:185 (+),score=24.60 TRINITY_DN506_c0_g1_i1:103-657(+)